MNLKWTVVVAIVLSLSISAEAGDDFSADSWTGIPNVVLLEDGVIGGGLPSSEGIQNALDQGVKTIIDLRTPQEGTAHEKKLVEEAGMRYFNVPVSANTFSIKEVDQVANILSDPANRPALLHCRSGGRVGALWALLLRRYQGVEEQKAYESGIEKGLKSRKWKGITKMLLPSAQPSS